MLNKKGELSCIECLINYGADLNMRDHLNERTSVHAASCNNKPDCLKLIAEVWQKTNQLARKYDTTPQIATAKSATTTTSANAVIEANENSGGMRTTIAQLARVRDKHGRTPLMLAIEHGHLNTAAFLIEAGVDVLDADDKKRTPLHRAAALGYEDTCAQLVRADPRTLLQKDANGLLAAHYATMAGHAGLIAQLIDFDTSSSSSSSSSSSPSTLLVDKQAFSLMHYACFNGHWSCVESLCELAAAPSSQRAHLTEMLVVPLQPHRSKQQVYYSKFSPLHAACYNSHDVCVSYLLDKFDNNKNNADSDDDDDDEAKRICEMRDASGNRPLHLCAMNNDCECVSLLLDAGCSLDAKNKQGMTPFMLAALNNSFDVMELLLATDDKRRVAAAAAAAAAGGATGGGSHRRIDLTSVEARGNTALHLALLNEHENCALFILDHADHGVMTQQHAPATLVNMANESGQTALHLAAANGYLTCVEILLSKGADIWLRDSKGKTPLLYCAKSEAVAECLELMLSRLMLMNNSVAVGVGGGGGGGGGNGMMSGGVSAGPLAGHHHHNKMAHGSNYPPNMMMMMMIASNHNTPTSHAKTAGG